MTHVHGEKFNLSKQRLYVLMMNNTVTTCLHLLHCSHYPYPFPRSSLQESSILHHTHFPLIHSPSHSLTYMESHGCMLSFTPSHTHHSPKPPYPYNPPNLFLSLNSRLPMGSSLKMPRGSLSLAHVDGPPCDARHRSFHQGKNYVRPTFNRSPDISHPEFCPADVPPSPDISHPAPNAEWERRRFNFPGQTCPDPLIVLTRRASTADNSDSLGQLGSSATRDSPDPFPPAIFCSS